MRAAHQVVFLTAAAAMVLFASDSMAASTVITSEPDGSINCDGLRCPPGGSIRCVVSANTANGVSTVNRQCIDPTGAVVAENSYNVESPGLSFARQTSTAILY